MKQLITKILLLSSLLTLGACSAESNQKTSNTDSTVSSSVKDTSSESKEKEEQKVKKIAEKKKLEKQKAKEEAERKQQEEKRKAEEQKQQAIAQEQARQVTQEQAVAQAKQQNNQQTVLITPTGKKYHNHVCGNGNYSPATLQEALNRGLTPCEKCYDGETTNPSEEITSSSTIEGEPVPSSEPVIDTNSSSSEINSKSTITVQSGEGPKQLAERAGITVDRLFELNGIDPNNYFLYPGQELRIK